MNDNQTSAFRNARVAITGVHYLRLIWSARLCLVGAGLSPWERLVDRFLWLGFIAWLRHDAQEERKERRDDAGKQADRQAPSETPI